MTDVTAHDLLRALAALGPRPALAWFGEGQRVELSGAVLANWIIKAIGHLHDEIALEEGELVVLDLSPHWKRFVLATAAWALGAQVDLAGSPSAHGRAARLLATADADAPGAHDADELLLLEPVSLSARWPGALPALAHDWVQEVRSSPDALQVPLPAWSGPAPAPVAAGGATVLEDDGLADAPSALGALLAGGRILGPAHAIDARAARDEGIGSPEHGADPQG